MFKDVIVNVIAGIIGGGFITLVTFLIRYIKNKNIEKKFPITGEYISRYEDLEDGEIVVRTAPATFKQKGKKITGETTFDGKRKWIISGEITFEGNFFGIYYAENPMDKGIGNFFLKIDNNKVMNGMWSGFDSENNQVSSGSYKFHPINKDIIIVNLEHKHIPDIISIGDAQIGKDFLEMPILENNLSNSDKFIGKVAIDTSRKKIAGFIISYIVDKEFITNMYDRGLEEIPRALTFTNEYGYLKSIAISEEYKGQSIGTRLVSSTIDRFKDLEISTIFSTAWKSTKGTNMKGIFDTLGFKELYEIKDYWKEDSIEKNYNCPVCGKPPCRCSSVIYAKFLI